MEIHHLVTAVREAILEKPPQIICNVKWDPNGTLVTNNNIGELVQGSSCNTIPILYLPQNKKLELHYIKCVPM